MTERVKQIVRSWIITCDEALPVESLSEELKQDRIQGIKSVISFLNRLESDGILDKMSITYPLAHPTKEYRTIPINFKP